MTNMFTYKLILMPRFEPELAIEKLTLALKHAVRIRSQAKRSALQT